MFLFNFKGVNRQSGSGSGKIESHWIHCVQDDAWGMERDSILERHGEHHIQVKWRPADDAAADAAARCVHSFTALFTKPLAGSRNDLRDRSPIHGFRFFQELYQAKLGTALPVAL